MGLVFNQSQTRLSLSPCRLSCLESALCLNAGFSRQLAVWIPSFVGPLEPQVYLLLNDFRFLEVILASASHQMALAKPV